MASDLYSGVMNSELEKIAPRIAAATVMMMMCHFHLKINWISERLLKLLSIVLSFVSMLNSEVVSVVFALCFALGFIFGTGSLFPKKAAVSVDKGQYQQQEDEGG